MSSDAIELNSEESQTEGEESNAIMQTGRVKTEERRNGDLGGQDDVNIKINSSPALQG